MSISVLHIAYVLVSLKGNIEQACRPTKCASQVQCTLCAYCETLYIYPVHVGERIHDFGLTETCFGNL